MLSSTYLEGSVSTSFANVVRDTCSFHLIESEEAIAAIAIAAANADDDDSEEWLPNKVAENRSREGSVLSATALHSDQNRAYVPVNGDDSPVATEGEPSARGQ